MTILPAQARMNVRRSIMRGTLTGGRSMERFGRSGAAISVLSRVGADHRREVGHRMPTTNGDVFGWQFVQLDETAVSRDPKRLEVVNDRRVEAAFRFDRSTRVANNCDVDVALRFVTIRRAHE